MARLLLDCVPDCVDIDADEDGYTVTVPVLSEVDGFRFVSLDVRLQPFPYDHPDTFEFSFGFTIADLDQSDETFFSQDRFVIERYFDGITREFVVPTVCACAIELVDAVQPNYIYRVTKGCDLPQKALVKHFAITDVLEELGYTEVQTGTDGWNRTFWLMSR